MNKLMFLQLLRQPGKISEDELRDLEKFAEQYPYCQSAHILIAKYYADNGHMLAGLKVKKAALYAADRTNLKHLIEQTEQENAEALKKTASFIPEKIVEIELPKIIQDVPVVKKEVQVETKTEEAEKKEEIPVVLKSEQEVISTEVKETAESTVVTINESTLDASKEALLEELRQSLISLRESRKKAFIQKEKPEDEQISKEALTTEYSTPDLQTEVTLVGENLQNEPVQKNVPEELPKELSTEEIPVLVLAENNLIQALDHYYPETGRGPLPIHSGREYKALETSDFDWLINYYNFQNQKRLVFKKNKKKEEEIINRLSLEEPVMPKMNAKNLPEETADLSTRSTTLQKGPISENFARILVLQGKTDKAIDIYAELSLKFPEKKAYFEAQIEKLKTKLG